MAFISKHASHSDDTCVYVCLVSGRVLSSSYWPTHSILSSSACQVLGARWAARWAGKNNSDPSNCEERVAEKGRAWPCLAAAGLSSLTVSRRDSERLYLLLISEDMSFCRGCKAEKKSSRETESIWCQCFFSLFIASNYLFPVTDVLRHTSLVAEWMWLLHGPLLPPSGQIRNCSCLKATSYDKLWKYRLII